MDGPGWRGSNVSSSGMTWTCRRPRRRARQAFTRIRRSQASNRSGSRRRGSSRQADTNASWVASLGVALVAEDRPGGPERRIGALEDEALERARIAARGAPHELGVDRLGADRWRRWPSAPSQSSARIGSSRGRTSGGHTPLMQGRAPRLGRDDGPSPVVGRHRGPRPRTQPAVRAGRAIRARQKPRRLPKEPPRCCPGEGVRRSGHFCHASRASITSAAPTTLTLPTHDLDAGAAWLTEQHRYPTPATGGFPRVLA